MKSIAIVTGGTAGHVFPAIALCEQIRKHSCTVPVDLFIDGRGARYLGSYRSLFRRIHILPIQKPSSWRYYLSLFFQWLRSLFLFLLKRPKVVIGFGGYFSVPTVFAAQLLGIKTALHEQNTLMGKANRFLCRFVDVIGVSFKETKKIPSFACQKTLWCGNFLLQARKNIDINPPIYDKQNVLHLLVTGGSQGASTLTKIICNLAVLLNPQTIKIWHQCPLSDVHALIMLYKKLGIQATVESFIDNMQEALAWSHVVMGRAGASTIAELLYFERPSILIPLKNSVEQDQRHNASFMEKNGASYILQEQDDEDLGAIAQILSPPYTALQTMSLCIKNIEKADDHAFINTILNM